MVKDTAQFASLAKRYKALGRADKKAVMASFSDDERVTFDQALAAEQAEKDAELERQNNADRQYLGYSRWLADIVESSVDGNDVPLTELAQKAVVDEHKAMISLLGTAPRKGWRGIVDQIGDVFTPKAGSSK